MGAKDGIFRLFLSGPGEGQSNSNKVSDSTGQKALKLMRFLKIIMDFLIIMVRTIYLIYKVIFFE